MVGLRKHKNIIIYIFILAVFISAQGMGLDDYKELLSKNEAGSIIYQTVEISNHLQTVHLEENDFLFEFVRCYKNVGRSKVYGQRDFIFLILLVILLGIFIISKFIYGLYKFKFHFQRAYVIAYIHDTDGRKRLSWS
ncbi:MAG: hypothetical protein J6P57_08070 [Lachnospiraceae bacterium]|nr:hypothetical protein [Lachnospiraceae bacterium]